MNLLGMVAQVVRIAVPYLFAASGGALAERSGVISLGLEGYMLAGAFGGTVGAYYTGSPWAGVACGIGAGLLFALLHALVSLRFRADQVVSGIAINLLVIGLTRFLLRLFFGSSSNSPRVPGFGVNPLVALALATPMAVAWLVYRTPFGLRVRAAGEHPEAAETLGVRVRRVRLIAVAASGALAALGGVYLALDQHQFTDEMTAGRGFIALAAVIFGRWDPMRAAVACLLFAAAETVQIQLQGAQAIPSQFIQMIPYLLTIIALAGVVGRAVPPAALGRAD
ncbi:MAG TPA: ABC transporter permease [Gemmatimonadaceae bacterium]|nr:ABC transporter permease [Gemmatimonadaceae bacterium]